MADPTRRRRASFHMRCSNDPTVASYLRSRSAVFGVAAPTAPSRTSARVSRTRQPRRTSGVTHAKMNGSCMAGLLLDPQSYSLRSPARSAVLLGPRLLACLPTTKF
eukprot:scaffold48809_cov75-Phaeocystis_antarctica.AAC.1